MLTLQQLKCCNDFRTVLCLILLFCSGLPTCAKDLRGLIVNGKQKPQKEVRLWKRNSFDFVKTDEKGGFCMADVDPADTIVVSFSYKLDAVFPVKDLSDIKITLDKKHYVVDDGVKQVRRDYEKVAKARYASNILVREQIMRSNANSIYELMRGAISGVTISYGDSGPMVSIRGGNSFSLDSEPLFIVDGMQYERSGDVDSNVSVADIVRLEVVKDGSAYGMKGSNGAIIITTLHAP